MIAHLFCEASHSGLEAHCCDCSSLLRGIPFGVRGLLLVLVVAGLGCLFSLERGRAGSGGCFSDSRPRGSGVVSVLVDWVRVGFESESVLGVDFVVSEVWDSPIRDLHV